MLGMVCYMAVTRTIALGITSKIDVMIQQWAVWQSLVQRTLIQYLLPGIQPCKVKIPPESVDTQVEMFVTGTGWNGWSWVWHTAECLASIEKCWDFLGPNSEVQKWVKSFRSESQGIPNFLRIVQCPHELLAKTATEGAHAPQKRLSLKVTYYLLSTFSAVCPA